DHRRQTALRVRPSAPVGPAGFIVLAIGVVVAALAVVDLVAGEDQRHALGQQQAGHQVLLQPQATLQDDGIVARSFHAAVLAVIFIAAVAIALAILLVVLLLVADEVVQREAVMRGNVVYAGARRLAAMLEEIVRADHAACQFADHAFFAAPEASLRLPELVVPL